MPRARATRTHRCLSVLVMALAMGISTSPGATAALPSVRAGTGEVTPVRALDLNRYSGTWLQLASVPQEFQRACVRDTRAVYTLLEDGLVRVENSCVRADGSTLSIEGRARVAGPGPAQLEVTFVQVGGQWLFEASAAYWVLGLDRRAPDYGWAVVGAPGRTSGFVLSRTPTLDVRQIAAAARTVIRNGYDPCDFTVTATTGGIEANVPLCEAAAAARTGTAVPR